MVDELLALDLLSLREHTERAGDALDAEALRARIEATLAISHCCSVRRDGRLAAYAMLQPEPAGGWFVTAFNTHPGHRTPAVLREFFAAFLALAQRLEVDELRSHVYKTNLASMAFHRRLGFRITRENAKGVEFVASMADIQARPLARSLALARLPAHG